MEIKKLNGLAKVLMDPLETVGLMTESSRQRVSEVAYGRKARQSFKHSANGTIFAFPSPCPPAE